MDDKVAVGSPQQCVEADECLRRGELIAHDLVGSGLERRREAIFAVAAQDHRGNDPGVGVVLEATTCVVDHLGTRASVERHHPRTSAQGDRHQLVGIADSEDDISLPRQPFGQHGWRWGVVRREEDGADLDQSCVRPRWKGNIRFSGSEVKPRWHCELRRYRRVLDQK